MNYFTKRWIATFTALASATTLSEKNTLKIELADLFLEMIGFGDMNPELLSKPVSKPMERPSVEEIRLYCAAKGIPASDADWFFHKMVGCGWKNGGKAVRSWQDTLTAWKLGGYLPSIKNGSRNGMHMGGMAAGPNEIRAELTKLHNQIRKGDLI